MKNIAKRLLSSLLCGLMIFPVLTACSNDESSATDATTTAATSTSKRQPAKSPIPDPPSDPNWVSAIYGGGPFVTGGAHTANLMKKTGFNTIMLWSVHVHEDGDLVFNDVKVCEDGAYVGNPEWSEAWLSLKEGETSITRVEISVGAWGCADFENIKALIERDGTGEDTILYRNFKALIEATGADAVNFDDESCYDVDSAVLFGRMCEAMGAKVTLCPFTNRNFWLNVKNRLGEELVDRIYLQCYGGGAGNVVSEWEDAFGMKVIPGYWNIKNGAYGKTAEEVGNELKANKDSVTGGFMWLYDEMKDNSTPNRSKDYAIAINKACD